MVRVLHVLLLFLLVAIGATACKNSDNSDDRAKDSNKGDLLCLECR